MTPRKAVAIVQSCYIPWKGYFDMIRRVDEFIFYDDAQYTRRDWRNRNLIKTPQGLHWLSIPVDVKGKYTQAIKDTRVSDSRWHQQHWKTIQTHYARSPHYRVCKDALEELYRAPQPESLSAINFKFTARICELLGIATTLSSSMDYELVEGRTERLVGLCQRVGANEYVSGPAARAYLDVALFEAAGVSVSFMDYGGYPEYPQSHPPFEHGVSIIDLLMNTGADARAYLSPAVSDSGVVRIGR